MINISSGSLRPVRLCGVCRFRCCPISSTVLNRRADKFKWRVPEISMRPCVCVCVPKINCVWTLDRNQNHTSNSLCRRVSSITNEKQKTTYFCPPHKLIGTVNQSKIGIVFFSSAFNFDGVHLSHIRAMRTLFGRFHRNNTTHAHRTTTKNTTERQKSNDRTNVKSVHDRRITNRTRMKFTDCPALTTLHQINWKTEKAREKKTKN